MSDVTVKKIDKYEREIACPPDKSISLRAVLLCSYAVGKSTIKNISVCDDVLSAAECANRLGATVNFAGSTAFITGAPFRSTSLDCGNSATLARLLTGLLAGLNGVFDITGDSSLVTRPMNRVTDPLAVMGARISTDGGRLPMRVIGSALGGLEYYMPISSAQVKSALLLAALNASAPVTVTEKIKTRDHTEIMLKQLNGKVRVDGNTVSCSPSILYGADITVPGDISSAVYPICLALATGGNITVRGVGVNPTRTGVLSILRGIGAKIITDNVTSGDEPYCDITVKCGKLKPIIIGEREATQAIDEIPALCALACFIDGVSVFDGVGELRVKESDRITGIVNVLKSLGANIEQTENGIVIYGGRPLEFGTVDPNGDHRIAMAAAIAAAAGAGGKVIGAECVSVSYPHFFEEVIGA